MGAVLELGALLALVAALLVVVADLLQRRGARAGGRVAEARAAEARVAALEERAAAAASDLDTLVDLVGVGVVRLDAGLSIVAANEAAHRLIGRRPGTMVGRGSMEAFTDHHVEEIARTALEAGSAAGEVVVRVEDGATLIARARRTSSGEVLLILEDVSELRRLQRIRTEFVDNLGHELRTPITTIRLLAETLAADTSGLPPRMAERIATLEIETGHLAQMVVEMLDLSAIEAGAGLNLEDVDLERLAVATAERMRPFAERHGVAVAVDCPVAVPLVRGDPERLGRALLNLLHNAVKFSPAGSTVSVRVTPAESRVVVAVEDHGPGIPRSALPRIFERFYKVDRARRRGSGGTGLGLSIARHVVEAHGGRIWAESEEGAGSTFSFALPVGDSELGATPGA